MLTYGIEVCLKLCKLVQLFYRCWQSKAVASFDFTKEKKQVIVFITRWHHFVL